MCLSIFLFFFLLAYTTAVNVCGPLAASVRLLNAFAPFVCACAGQATAAPMRSPLTFFFLFLVQYGTNIIVNNTEKLKEKERKKNKTM